VCFIEEEGWGYAEAVLKAVIAHLYIAWIHPFGDGNGRTARLVEYLLLVNAGVPCLAGHLLSNHYNKTRQMYYRRLQEASANAAGDVVGFFEYALDGYVDELKASLWKIRSFQRDLVWRDYINESFPREGSGIALRQKRLVVEIAASVSRTGSAVRAHDVPMLSEVTAMAYDGVTVKTISRDLTACVKLGLLRKVQEGYVANVGIVESFMPLQRQSKAIHSRVSP
jgi:Fic family protein